MLAGRPVIEHAGIRYVAGIGRFGDGRLAEVFLNGAKCGTDLETAAKESAILASFARLSFPKTISGRNEREAQTNGIGLSGPAQRRIFAQGQVRAHFPYTTEQRIFAFLKEQGISRKKNRAFRWDEYFDQTGFVDGLY
jgi:hypothetical protein